MEAKVEGRRARFCAELDGNIGKIIFGHLHHFLILRICWGVNKDWRQLVDHPGFRVNRGMFEDFMRDHQDAHMGCLRLWMGRRFALTISPDNQRDLVEYAIQSDLPTALTLFLAHGSARPQFTPVEMLEYAIPSRARAVITQVLMPWFGATGKFAELFANMFSHSCAELFAWYWRQFPTPYIKADRIRIYAPHEVDEKIAVMCEFNGNSDIGWWRKWFDAAAGIRPVLGNGKGYHEYHSEEDRQYYSPDVAVAIVKHVLHGVPGHARLFLSNRKIRITRTRDDALLARLDGAKPKVKSMKKKRKV